MKRYLAVPFAIATAMVALFLNLTTADAQALAARTWVSGTGDDTNACSRTAPCKTFAGALSKTSIHGEINCLDPGGFAGLQIEKSVTIDCHDAGGAITNMGAAPAVTIDFDQFDPSDTQPQVILRKLTTQGVNDGAAGIQIVGVGQGSFVSIEDCVVNGNYNVGASLAGYPSGILDQRNRGALAIDNTIVRNNGLYGISIASSSNGSRRAIISNTRILNSNIGVNVGLDANVVLSHSIVSNNATAGLQVGTSGVLIVDSTTISHNGNGIQNSGTVRLSNSDLTLNTAAISGSVLSFTNNRFSNNGSVGTIVPIGTAANPTGEQ
jgi:parallel beta helix pectate lyase-like protein